jgi:hypothetical protein|tara:strand:- start:670 stop:819 length:150 start_codon:yes stop_codon:yes gene_type:complete
VPVLAVTNDVHNHVGFPPLSPFNGELENLRNRLHVVAVYVKHGNVDALR